MPFTRACQQRCGRNWRRNEAKVGKVGVEAFWMLPRQSLCCCLQERWPRRPRPREEEQTHQPRGVQARSWGWSEKRREAVDLGWNVREGLTQSLDSQAKTTPVSLAGWPAPPVDILAQLVPYKGVRHIPMGFQPFPRPGPKQLLSGVLSQGGDTDTGDRRPSPRALMPIPYL